MVIGIPQIEGEQEALVIPEGLRRGPPPRRHLLASEPAGDLDGLARPVTRLVRGEGDSQRPLCRLAWGGSAATCCALVCVGSIACTPSAASGALQLINSAAASTSSNTQYIPTVSS